MVERAFLFYFRGTVNLAGAFIDTIDATNFVITNGPQVSVHVVVQCTVLR